MEEILLKEHVDDPEFTAWVETVMQILKEADLLELVNDMVIPSHRTTGVLMLGHSPVMANLQRIIFLGMQIQVKLAEAEQKGDTKVMLILEDEDPSLIIVKH